MKKKIIYYLEYLYVSTYLFYNNIKSKNDNYDSAYMALSLTMAVNLFSILMLFKYILDFKINIGKLIFLILIGLPPLILNHYLFIRKKRYIILINEIKTTSLSFIIYLLLSLLFFIITGYINIPK